MANKISKKATTKKTAPKTTTKKITPKKVNAAAPKSNKLSRKDQMDCSNLIFIGTGIVILLVIGYISIEYFMI